MAKTNDLSRVGERQKLQPLPNSAPYWQRLRPGLHLGYRPAAAGVPGAWIAKANVDGKLQQQTLESFGQFDANERFAKAVAAAEAFMGVQAAGGDANALTISVADAARAYVVDRPDAGRFFEKSVYHDPIAIIPLDKLRYSHLKAWRTRLEERPTERLKSATRVRAPSSINREMTPLRAALRKVLAPGQPDPKNPPWQAALTKIRFKASTRRRKLTLSRPQRQALLASCSAEAEPFVRALCLLPVRPGALARLTVADWDKRTRELTIPWDKAGAGRTIQVGVAAAALLTQQAKGKTPATLLFLQDSREVWTAATWKLPIRAAAAAAELPKGVCAYTLRHSVLTDLVDTGEPILTIATLAGTSVEMIQDYYGHLTEKSAAKALDSLAL